MAIHIRTLALALGLCGASAAAEAATYRVDVLATSFIVCKGVTASTHHGAFRQCMERLGIIVPSWAATTTTTRVCRSTHIVRQVSPAQPARYAYDSRANPNGCP